MRIFTRSGVTQSIAALCIFVVLTAFWVWVDTPEFFNNFIRNSQACAVRQIANFPPDTDFLILGSSRVRRGISPDKLIEMSEGEVLRPMNLGRNGLVSFRNYTMFREILSRDNNIKYAFVEVNIQALAGYNRRATLFADKPQNAMVARTDYGTIGSTLSLLPPQERIRALLMLEYLKIKHGLVSLFSGVAIESYAQLNQPANSVCWQRNFDIQNARKIKKIGQAQERNIRVFGPLGLATRDFDYADTWGAVAELELLNKISMLANDNDIKLIVGRPYSVYQPPFSEEAVARIKELAPEFEQPPAELIREMWSGYTDESHMGKEARDMYTSWMAELILGGLE